MFLIASSFLAGRKVPPADDNIGRVIFDFLDFQAHKCNHADAVFGPAGVAERVGYDGIQEYAHNDLIVINPCPGISEDVNTTKGCVITW